MNTAGTNDSELDLARSRLYGLLGELFLNGVTKGNYDQIIAIDELASELPIPFDGDQAAATHYDILEHQVPPYESLFRDSSGLIGGQFSDDVGDTYRSFGIQTGSTDRSCDHFGVQMRALAELCLREFAASTGNDSRDVERYRMHLRKMLFEHVMQWIHPLSIAVHEQENPFFNTVMDLTVELAESHTADLGAEDDSELPVIRLESSAESGSIRDMEFSEHLTKAACCGFFMTRTAIAEIGRRLQLPRGFGTRQLMLQNLLQVATKFELTGPLLAELDSYCESVVKYYAGRIDAVSCLRTRLSGRIDAVRRTQKMVKQFELDCARQ